MKHQVFFRSKAMHRINMMPALWKRSFGEGGNRVSGHIRTIAGVVLFLLCVAYAGPSFSDTPPARLIRGERPPIDYTAISEDDFEKGVFKIKFVDEKEGHLKTNPVTVTSDSIVRFNLQSVDILNEQFKVKSAVQHFSSGAFRNGFTERHRAWGFHLWYRLEVPEDADVLEMVQAYRNVKEIVVAEPFFKKKQIAGGEVASPVVLDMDSSEKLTPNDPLYPFQWNMHNTGQAGGAPGADIRMNEAWEIERGDANVIVAVIDGAIYYPHEDLAGNMWADLGYNFTIDSPLLDSPSDHGTHIGGIISAVSNNNIGLAGIAGGGGDGDGVRLMSCQVFGSYYSGGFHLAPIYAADEGATIAQNSWGYINPGYYEQDVLDAIDYFNQHGGGDAMTGGLTVFAAGNTGSGQEMWPGYYSGTLAVAATDNRDKRANYSTYGPWIDVTAPGGSFRPVDAGILSTLTYDRYGFLLGTSMAAPQVSGVAALIVSHNYGTFSGNQVADILINSTDYFYDENPYYVGHLGTGRINAYEALKLSENYLTLPGKPTQISATPTGESALSIHWSPNSAGDDVMLAWSIDGKFGRPQTGVVYEEGDQIEEGGYVLYAGNENNFAHDGLSPSTRYYYRAWSVDEQVEYSVGVSALEFTDCGIRDLPFVERFAGIDMPHCWSLPDGEGNWNVHEAYGVSGPGALFHWAPVREDYSYALESPLLDGNIAGDEIALRFDVQLDQWDHIATDERLTVQIHDGSAWHDLLEFKKENGCFPYETHIVDITSYAIDKLFTLRFTAHGEYSVAINHWAIDNVMVYSSSCHYPVAMDLKEKTSDSVTIVWDAEEEDAQWDLVYGPYGLSPDNQGEWVYGISTNRHTISDLEPYTGYDVYVRTDCGGGDVSLLTGPLHVRTLPLCPEPANLQIKSITSTTALVSWEPGLEEEEWIIAFGEPGFNPVFEGTFSEYIINTEYELTDLAPMTSYEVYVKGVCNEEEESFWVGPEYIRTLCPVFAVPHTECFSGALDECWDFPEGIGNWSFGNAHMPPSSVSGAPNVYFTWDPVAHHYEYPLVSPVYDATHSNDPVMLAFILYLNSYNENTTEQIAVEYATITEEGNQEWIPLETFSNLGAGSSSNEFVRYNLLLEEAAGSFFQVRFVALGDNSFSINGWGLDDVSVYHTPRHKVTISSEGPGTTNPAKLILANEGDSAQIHFTALEGGHIDGVWLDGMSVIDDVELENSNSPSYGVLSLPEIQSSHDVRVKFEYNRYEVVLRVEPEGAGEVFGCGVYSHNELVHIQAVPFDDYEFIHWCDGESVFSYMPDISFAATAETELVAVMDLISDIGEMPAVSEITVYPNPAKDKVWVEFTNNNQPEVLVSLYSSFGQRIKERTTEAQGSVQLSFDLTDLAPGVYMIRFDHANYNQKIIVR